MTAELPRMSLPSHVAVRSYSMDSNVANHLVQTVEVSRLLGAAVIVTGMSPEITQTLVTLGVDPGKMNTVGDLQGGIEQAERLLGYKVEALAEPR